MPTGTSTPSEILIPALYMNDQAPKATTSIIECELSSRAQREPN